MIRLFKSGDHAHRSPLSYPALTELFEHEVEFVANPDNADLLLFAHTLDVEKAPLSLVESWRRTFRPIVVLSEEPFWDSIWGKRPLLRETSYDTDFGTLPVFQLNHGTSSIFDFDQIPYYLLTNPRFAKAYHRHFSRNAAKSPADWRDEFASREVDLTFMAERRPEAYHNVRFPHGIIFGLCAFRTQLAEACTQGSVERIGASWGNGLSRFEATDWHMDKMTRLDGRMRQMSALENTHQPTYVTEKIFDAFALGAMPHYFASPEHRVHGFGLPEESWLNLFDLPVDEAAERVENATYHADFFDAFAEAQQMLMARFTNPDLFTAERDRLKHAVLEELGLVLDGDPWV